MFVAFQAGIRQSAVKPLQLRFMSSLPATMKVRRLFPKTWMFLFTLTIHFLPCIIVSHIYLCEWISF